LNDEFNKQNYLKHHSILNDRTHKMERPVSNPIHTIGNSFSGSAINKEK